MLDVSFCLMMDRINARRNTLVRDCSTTVYNTLWSLLMCLMDFTKLVVFVIPSGSTHAFFMATQILVWSLEASNGAYI